MSVGDEPEKPKSHMLELSIQYFKKEGYKINKESVVMEGFSGETRHFDLIV